MSDRNKDIGIEEKKKKKEMKESDGYKIRNIIGLLLPLQAQRTNTVEIHY